MFQLTRPHGARHDVTACMTVTECFNSRARMERDTNCEPSNPTAMSFNSRARMERDEMLDLQHQTDAKRFNSRARMERDGSCRKHR